MPFEDAVAEIFAATKVLRRLLEASEALPPLPPLKVSITKIDAETLRILAKLERLGVKVGATTGDNKEGDKGGPGTRLMRRILGYTSHAPKFDTLKQRIIKARELRQKGASKKIQARTPTVG